MKAASKKRDSKKAPARRRVRAGGLSERDILDAALALIRDRGVEALSMRTLAQKLGVSAMAIYYYVPNKEALLERVALSLTDCIPMPAPSRIEWEGQLRQYAFAIWDVLSIYPGLSRIVLERPPAKAFGRANLYVISLMQTAGFDGQHAVLASLSFHTQLSGLLSGQARLHALRQRKPRKKRTPRSQDLSEVRKVMETLQSVTPRAWMEFSIETVLAGLRTQRDALRTAHKRSAASEERAPSRAEPRARSSE